MKGMVLGFIVVCAAAVPIQPGQAIRDESVRASDDDVEMVGGYGVKEVIPVTMIPQSTPQSYSLLEEDEGEDDDIADSPVVQDASSEVQEAKGQSHVMKNSGLGHMVGSNDVVKKTATQVDAKLNLQKSQIAELKGLIDLTQGERKEAKQKLADRKNSQSTLLDELKKSYDEKLQAMKAEHEQQIASVKKEAAIKLKHIRNEMEKDIEAKRAEKLHAMKESKMSVESQVKALQEDIANQKARIAEANKKAEAIYSKNRAAWKKRHDEELQTSGIKGELAQVESALEAQKSRLNDAKSREASIKERIRDLGRQKVLMAARLKNLHAREESLKGTEDKINKENELLRHQIQELDLTQRATATVVKQSEQETEEAARVALAAAKAKAEDDVKSFEEKLLQTTQAEIVKLKEGLRTRDIHEAKAEKNLLQEERNVQAEQKEADDAFNKAKRDAEIAQKQIEIELQKAKSAARDIVEEARRKAARIREDARISGVKEGMTEAQTLLDEKTKQADELSVKETELTKLKSEFKEKMEHQVAQHEKDLAEKTEAERSEMKRKVENEIQGNLLHQKKDLEDAISHRHNDYLTELARAEKEETDIKNIDKENEELRAQVEKAKFEVAHQKQELDKQLIETPVD